jgi:hypothetical protein
MKSRKRKSIKNTLISFNKEEFLIFVNYLFKELVFSIPVMDPGISPEILRLPEADSRGLSFC